MQYILFIIYSLASKLNEIVSDDFIFILVFPFDIEFSVDDVESTIGYRYYSIFLYLMLV